MSIPEFCESLKDLGVVEVLLEEDEDNNKLPVIVIAGLSNITSEHFNLRITNEDFAKYGL